MSGQRRLKHPVFSLEKSRPQIYKYSKNSVQTIEFIFKKEYKYRTRLLRVYYALLTVTQGSLNFQTDFNKNIKSDLNRKVNCSCNFQVGWPWKHSPGFLRQVIFLLVRKNECQAALLRFYSDDEGWFSLRIFEIMEISVC